MIVLKDDEQIKSKVYLKQRFIINCNLKYVDPALNHHFLE